MIAHPPSPADPPALPSDMVVPAVPHGAEPESAIAGPIAGRYDVGDRIARGGMGLIYRAHDRHLNRTVAVKVMRSRFMDRPDLLRRFMAEGRINGRLQHPNVVPIYEVGVLADTRPFIAMKLIEGKTLARLLRERTDPADNLAHYLKVFEQVVQAVAYAHAKGIIHRDLKPENVMVGEFAEVQVMDWGLAKYLNPADAVAHIPDGFEAVEKSAYLSGEGSAHGDYQTQAVAVYPVSPDDPTVGNTTAGEVFGTLPYMPPEQARGETDRVDRRSDVFALGAILCQVLTGQPPYFGAPETLRDQARGGKLFGAYVLLDRCGADPPLVLLAKHCLAIDPAARPADAGMLAAMVAQCLEGLQDRTRQLEVSRLAAEARLAEAEAREALARKARRLARMLAVASVMVAALLVAWIGYYTNHQVARASDETHRRAAALHQVEEALAEADAHYQEARSAPGGPLVRDAAARQALSACQRAEGLLAGVPEPPPDLRDRIAALKAGVAETDRGLDLSLALDRWRAELFDSRGVLNPLAVQGCREILSGNGVNVWESPTTAAEAVRDHPAGDSIRAALADYLAVCPNPNERDFVGRFLGSVPGSPSQGWLSAVGRGDPDQLIKVADNPSEPPVPVASVVTVARRLITDGKVADGERLLTHGAGRHPTDFTINRLLGGLLRDRGQPAEAVRYLTTARAARPADVAVGLELGLALADANRPDEALEVLREVSREAPRLVPAHVRVGEILLAQGEADAARNRFTTAVELAPASGPALLGLGRAELARGDLDAAAKAFQTATASTEHAAAAHAGLGQIHLTRWEAAKAVAQFRSAVEAQPANTDYRLGLVRALRVANDTGGALREARAAVRVSPKSAAAHRAVGELLAVTGDRAEAAEAYRAAVQCDPKDVDAHQRLAALYEGLNDPAAAAAAYQAVADLRPTDLKARLAVGRARQKAGDWPGAAEAFRRAAAIDPADASIRQQLGLSLATGGDEAGIDELTALAESLPDSGDVRADLGHALAQLGRFRAAAAAYRAAAERFPEDTPKHDAARTAARVATRMAALEDRLPELQAGGVKMSTPAAWAEVGEVCRRTKRYAAAARFFEEATAGDPKYAGPAATCAALAGFGRGADAKELSEAARAEWRKSALAAFQKSPALARDAAVQGLRDGLDGLPASEREQWQAVWKR